MIPMIEGTTIIGMTGAGIEIHQAAEVSVVASRNLLVATETFSGAPITRFSTGTLAQPAPSGHASHEADTDKRMSPGSCDGSSSQCSCRMRARDRHR